LAFAFGINLSVSRLGSVVNGIVETPIAQAHKSPEYPYGNISAALWVGFAVCVFSWFCGLGLCLVDSYADKKDGKSA